MKSLVRANAVARRKQLLARLVASVHQYERYPQLDKAFAMQKAAVKLAMFEQKYADVLPAVPLATATTIEKCAAFKNGSLSWESLTRYFANHVTRSWQVTYR
jgi:hypothetical protein